MVILGYLFYLDAGTIKQQITRAAAYAYTQYLYIHVPGRRLSYIPPRYARRFSKPLGVRSQRRRRHPTCCEQQGCHRRRKLLCRLSSQPKVPPHHARRQATCCRQQACHCARVTLAGAFAAPQGRAPPAHMLKTAGLASRASYTCGCIRPFPPPVLRVVRPAGFCVAPLPRKRGAPCYRVAWVVVGTSNRGAYI